MEAAQSGQSSTEETNIEYRVQVSSKKRVMEQINRYKEVLKKVLDGQTEVSEETKQELLGELLAVGLYTGTVLQSFIGLLTQI